MARPDFEDSFQRLRKKGGRRAQGRRSVNALQGGEKGAFSDPTLAALSDLGHLHELLGELKSGKEATVYLGRGPQGLCAVKLYKELITRSFKNDAVYREGRFIGDARIEKAIRQRSATGVNAQQAIWVMHEYAQLWALHGAGLPVPRPLIGPGVKDCAASGRAVVMEFIGGEDDPAPRLSDARLTPEEARSAWDQSLNILARLLSLKLAHGDYSTYNLLWWEDRVIVIDVPQVVRQDESPHFGALFERDVRSLCQSFARLGVREDAAQTSHEVRKRARKLEGRELVLP